MRINSSGNLLVGGTASLSPAVNTVEISINNPLTSSNGGAVLALGIQGSRAGYLIADSSTNVELNSTSGYAQLSTSGGSVRLTSAGNFGIGKAPSTKLDVSGTITGTNIIITGEYSGTISGGTY
jgi:hypothetical protein